VTFYSFKSWACYKQGCTKFNMLNNTTINWQSCITYSTIFITPCDNKFCGRIFIYIHIKHIVFQNLVHKKKDSTLYLNTKQKQMFCSHSPPSYVDPCMGINPDQHSEEEASCYTGCQHKGQPIPVNKSTWEKKSVDLCWTLRAFVGNCTHCWHIKQLMPTNIFF